MSEKEKILAQEVSELLAEAEAIDRAEDARYGKNRRGDELPAGLRRREDRLAKIREAKAALASEAAAERSRARSAERGEDEQTAEVNAAVAAEKAAPKPKAQRNFTDPESKIMKTSDGSFHQCYNGQAVVDDEHQVIVAADLNDCAADVANLIPMTEQATRNAGKAPQQVLADAGYCSADNLDAAADYNAEHGSEFFIATGRRSHDEPPPVAPRGPIPKTATPKQRMARNLITKDGRVAYARRKSRPASSRPSSSSRSATWHANHTASAIPSIANSAACSVPAGPYRLLYRIDDDVQQVYIVHINHRADAYRPRREQISVQHDPARIATSDLPDPDPGRARGLAGALGSIAGVEGR